MFAHGLLGGTDPSAAAGSVDDSPLGLAYRTSAAEMLAVFRSPGALERPLTLTIGTVPGSLAVHLRAVEALVHGWDLAQATGQPFGPSRPAAESLLAVDRLAALLGGDVTTAGDSRGSNCRCVKQL